MTLGGRFQDLFEEVFEVVDDVWTDLEEDFEVLYTEDDVEWDDEVQVEWDDEVEWDDSSVPILDLEVHWFDENEQFGHVLNPMDIAPSEVDWDDGM